MYVSRQECPLHPLKRFLDVSLERFNHHLLPLRLVEPKYYKKGLQGGT